MNESAKYISELLRSIDKIIKAGNFEEAKNLIEKILEINPKNIYARAYSERISSLLKETQEKGSTPASSSPKKPDQEQTIFPLPVEKETEQAPLVLHRKLSDAILVAYKLSTVEGRLRRAREMQRTIDI